MMIRTSTALLALSLAAPAFAEPAGPGWGPPPGRPDDLPRTSGGSGGDIRPMPRPDYLIETENGAYRTNDPAGITYGFFDSRVDRMRWFTSRDLRNDEYKEAKEAAKEAVEDAKEDVQRARLNERKNALKRAKARRDAAKAHLRSIQNSRDRADHGDSDKTSAGNNRSGSGNGNGQGNSH